MNLSTLSRYIDIEISPYCMVNPKAFTLWKSRKMGMVQGFSTYREHGIIVGIK